MENGMAAPNGGADVRPERSGKATRPSISTWPNSAGSNAHKRSLSGSILAKLSFLRSSTEETLPLSSLPQPDLDLLDDDATTRKGGAMANALHQTKTRRRKGSLRKTAILGTGKLRRSYELQRSPSSWHAEQQHVEDGSPTSPEDPMAPSFSYENPSAASSEDNGWTQPSAQKLSLHTDPSSAPTSQEPDQPTAALRSPITSPISNPYGSTTDDDDALTFSRPAPPGSMLPAGDPTYLHLPSTAPSSLQRRRSTKPPHPHPHPAHTLPLPPPPPPPLLEDESWDYTETEWWGWVVLVSTWVVFVVGMGSCMGVWSWAWDVGETPYAPPELEDDATLPIVGYYPALMVLTAVMAWVWVVVAWVGMKYFRHAKVVAEEG